VRILWVKAGKLLPVDTGGKIRSYNLLKNLAGANEVTLLSYYDGPFDPDYEKQIVQELPGAITVRTGVSTSTLGQSMNYLVHLPSRAPYAINKFTSNQVRRMLVDWDHENRFDVFVCDFLSASHNFPAKLKTPSVLFQHNVESVLWERQSKHETTLLKRYVFKLESTKMTRYEREALGRFDHIVAVSTVDHDTMNAMKEGLQISVVPTGVDLHSYTAANNAGESNGNTVLFLGSMDWEPNIDGVDYFCREVWPIVNRAVSSAKFVVVGRNPPARIRKWASESVEITGRVDSVIPYLRQADVFVVPLRAGGGTRLKIYEAMAAGKAVVSTSVGAEGLDVHHGVDILLADTNADFAAAVIKLLNDSSARQALGVAAASLAAKYDWPVIAKRFEEILMNVGRAGSAFRGTHELAEVNA
jgi:glycosyltransferase involved in cell wall biosynthesis